MFEYNRVAMGLKNVCAHAQSCLQKAIDDDPILRRYDVRNYFDDIPLAAKTEDEFCELLEAMLALGKRMNLKFNRDKSVFGVDSITHVGFVVRHEGVEVDPMRVDALRQIAEPHSVKGVQSVLGAWIYIRNFIPNFSSRALPLTELVGSVKGANGKKKPKPFVWTDKCQGAFDDLKAATLDTKLLANIDFTKEIFIRCDSSQFGAGAVLFQINEHGQEAPIAYASRKYTLAERNYCTFQQEAGAVVWALEKFACFFQGHPVTVQSDHKNLSWVKKSAMPQLTRWRLRLQDFDFRIEYLPGPLNICADGLSREGVWVLARVRDNAPLDKWKPRWAGPFRLLDFKSQTQSIVRLWDTVHNKVIEAHLNDVELWNHRFTESVEGLTKVAEYDGWQYPMDGITAMALTPADPDEEYVTHLTHEGKYTRGYKRLEI